jgi:hypothetical protein
MHMADQNEILEIERQFWTEGPKVYHAHADETCTVVFAQMAQTMKRDAIAATAEAGRWRDVSLVSKEFRELSRDAVLFVYECKATRKDGASHYAYASSVYVKRSGGWKLAFHQQTEI